MNSHAIEEMMEDYQKIGEQIKTRAERAVREYNRILTKALKDDPELRKCLMTWPSPDMYDIRLQIVEKSEIQIEFNYDGTLVTITSPMLADDTYVMAVTEYANKKVKVVQDRNSHRRNKSRAGLLIEKEKLEADLNRLTKALDDLCTE